MLAILKKVILLTIIVILGFISMPGTILAWDDCAKGLVNDPYPGECARYIDTDNDGICDHSQPAPEDRQVNEQNTETTTDTLANESDLNSLEKVQSVETMALISQNQDNKPIKKLIPVVGMVFFYLTIILLYARYKKNKVKSK
jgi:hypothetical protein